MSTALEPTFRPPDGKEILFAGEDYSAANGGPGLFAIDPVSGPIRTIVEVGGNADLDSGSWAPDGGQLSYVSWDTTANDLTATTHIVSADGTNDRTLPRPPGALWDVAAAWSNDGTRLLLIRGYPASGRTRGQS